MAGRGPDTLQRVSEDVVVCRKCPRLVEWRELVAVQKRKSFQDWEYWGRPVPGFGDPEARVFVVGLAPAAHGGNRTGRIFTGDRSGDYLYAALFATGYANQPTSVCRDDGLALRDVYVAAAVRCAPPDNRPAESERQNCQPYLERELRLLPRARVIVALGAFAYRCLGLTLQLKRKPPFGHGREVEMDDGRVILCSYHPSQRNTFTGLLNMDMFEAIFRRARELSEGGAMA